MMNKKGLSVMIGYVLLVTAVVVMGVLVTQWLRSYVPVEEIECPDNVFIFIKDYTYDGSELSLTLKNNGKFSIAGYFIHATEEEGQELATLDLSQYLNENGAKKLRDSVLFAFGDDNSMKPGDEITNTFNLPDANQIYSVEIIPTRFQEVDNKKKFVSCGNVKVREDMVLG